MRSAKVAWLFFPLSLSILRRAIDAGYEAWSSVHLTL